MKINRQIRRLEKRVSELERQADLTAYDIITQYLRNRLDEICYPSISSFDYRNYHYSEGRLFELNCKRLLTTTLGIKSIRDIKRYMIDDAKSIIDLSIELFEKHNVK